MKKIKKFLFGEMTIQNSVMMVVASCALCFILNSILSPFVAGDVNYQDSNANYETYSIPMLILTSCIIAPIFEEFIFRGLFFEAFKTLIGFFKLKKIAPYIAAVFSASLFGAAHWNWIQFIFGFIMGLFMCNAYETQKTLLAPILIHMTSNTFSLILSHIPFLANTYIVIALDIVFIFVAYWSLKVLREMVKNDEANEQIDGEVI